MFLRAAAFIAWIFTSDLNDSLPITVCKQGHFSNQSHLIYLLIERWVFKVGISALNSATNECERQISES
ncbi:hypothetical protein Y1Q_0002659 [Alligator mississippiensis]|uniref:Uncharacterized protein n=1 Tax=Alligator mississippiensis TaxID=8496 RepID=A0A151P020_ALLMI|nr:hypothetical protein Y1Q_0002659 [Alligator mississippiensis]